MKNPDNSTSHQDEEITDELWNIFDPDGDKVEKYVNSAKSIEAGTKSWSNFRLESYPLGSLTEDILFALVEELARRVGEELGSGYESTAEKILKGDYRGIRLNLKKL